MIDKTILAENVYNLRKKLGLSQRELSELTQLDPKTIIGIEKERLNPTLDTLSRISQAINCETYELLMKQKPE